MAFQDKKFLDAEGITHLVRLLDEYPNNQVLGSVIDAIEGELEGKAEKSEIPEVPVQDVQVNGTSILNNGTANIPIAASDTIGAVKLGDTISVSQSGFINFRAVGASEVKGGVSYARALTPERQHASTFYGLTKAAGVDMKDSSNPVGTYTPEAKGAIQKMLGVSDLIATEENNLVASKAYAVGDVFTANGKLYKATATIATDGAIITDGASANCEEVTVADGFVKKTDYATTNTAGIVKIGAGLIINQSNDLLVDYANNTDVKLGTNYRKPITSYMQHQSTFYGLAKAAGDTTQSGSDNAVGTYTNEAKAAIRTMLGAGKVDDIQINGVSVLNNGIANIPKGSSGTLGVITTDVQYGLWIDGNGILRQSSTTSDIIKAGTDAFRAVHPSIQHEATFYGLAKAAGADEKDSTLSVGQYTDNAKTAIRTMIGAGTINDVQINSNSIVSNGVANIPIGTQNTLGVVMPNQYGGIAVNNSGQINIYRATDDEIKAGTNIYKPIVAGNASTAIFYSLAKVAGDTTQAASSNEVGIYTSEAKTAIQEMLGVESGVSYLETHSETDPVIVGAANTRYMCGEVTTLSITPPSSGAIDIIFTSGTTPTILTVPSTVKFPDWFDVTTLETNMTYEINILDGTYGAVMSWSV